MSELCNLFIIHMHILCYIVFIHLFCVYLYAIISVTTR